MNSKTSKLLNKFATYLIESHTLSNTDYSKKRHLRKLKNNWKKMSKLQKTKERQSILHLLEQEK